MSGAQTGSAVRLDCKALLWIVLAALAWPLWAQDLAPRAYVITPKESNAIILTNSFFDGGVNFNGAVPITDATGTFTVPVFSFYHSFGLLGRSANLTLSLPYGVGTFQGELRQEHRQIYRSGLMDFSARFAVNLIGGPAMPAPKFAKWKQKALLGASLKVIAPTGQYDPIKLINWGINRWAFKPEVGYSQRWGNWLLDAYGGVWFYTTNPAFDAGSTSKPQHEEPVGAFEGHFSHDFKPGTWVSLDGNFWWGGLTSVSGIEKLATKQAGSRMGGTAAWRFSKHQSLKGSYSAGTYSRFGGNYQSVSVAWQYSWLGWAVK